MDPERWKKIRELTERVLEAQENDRDRLLGEIERDDPDMRQEVERIVQSDKDGGR